MAGLIAWRIYRVPSVTSDRSTRLLQVFIVMIETGALYAMSVLALLIAFLSRSNGKSAALNVITPIVVSFLTKSQSIRKTFF